MLWTFFLKVSGQMDITNDVYVKFWLGSMTKIIFFVIDLLPFSSSINQIKPSLLILCFIYWNIALPEKIKLLFVLFFGSWLVVFLIISYLGFRKNMVPGTHMRKIKRIRRLGTEIPNLTPKPKKNPRVFAPASCRNFWPIWRIALALSSSFFSKAHNMSPQPRLSHVKPILSRQCFSCVWNTCRKLIFFDGYLPFRSVINLKNVFLETKGYSLLNTKKRNSLILILKS